MKEIKFRIWNPTYGMMPVRTLFDMTSFKFDHGNGVKILESSYPPETIFQQYTGLTDKNGKEIYEGDIIKADNSKHKCKVSWDNKYASFVLTREDWVYRHFFGEACDPEDCEVIGNIYETIELLTTP